MEPFFLPELAHRNIESLTELNANYESFKQSQQNLSIPGRIRDLKAKIKNLVQDYLGLSTFASLTDPQTPASETEREILCKYVPRIAVPNFTKNLVKTREIAQLVLNSIKESHKALEMQKKFYVEQLRNSSTTTTTSSSPSHTAPSSSSPSYLPNLTHPSIPSPTSTQFNSTPKEHHPVSSRTQPSVPCYSRPPISSPRKTPTAPFSQTPTHSSLTPPLPSSFHTPTKPTLPPSTHLPQPSTNLSQSTPKPAIAEPSHQHIRDLVKVELIIQKHYEIYQNKIRLAGTLEEKQGIITDFKTKLENFISTRNLTQSHIHQLDAFLKKLPPFAVE